MLFSRTGKEPLGGCDVTPFTYELLLAISKRRAGVMETASPGRRMLIMLGVQEEWANAFLLAFAGFGFCVIVKLKL